MKVNAIIQARCGSTRFPNKVFTLIDGKPLLWHVVSRLKYSKNIDDIIIATTTNSVDDEIERWCYENSIHCYRGSENDVLNRFYNASKQFPSEVVVRITADDPFKEPAVIDKIIDTYMNGGYDYVTNNFPPSFPEGLDCEVFSSKLLVEMEEKSNDSFEREHVTQYVFRHKENYSIGNVSNEQNLSYLRWTIDTFDDLEMVKEIYDHRDGKNGILLMSEILEILGKYPEIIKINSNVARSSMYKGE